MKKKILIVLAFAVFLGALGWSCAAAFGGAAVRGSGEDVTVVCLKTRNDADCTLLVQGENAALIDAGQAADADAILSALKQYGVGKLDLLVLTDADSDHIGGATALLGSVAIDTVAEPYQTGTSDAMKTLNDAFLSAGVRVLYPTHTRRVRVGGMTLLLYPPLEKHYADPGNSSLAVLVQHGDVQMFFAGDAKRKRTEELLRTDWPAVELYHVARHGHANSATTDLFAALQPQYAVVTAEEADEEVVDAARSAGSRLLYTAYSTLVFQSDGKSLTLLH